MPATQFSPMFAMFQSLCFLAVISSANLQFRQFDEAMERILHGKTVDISDYPYQVALVAHRNNRKRIICGGALVRPGIVFTAAHCTRHMKFDADRKNVQVLVGANHLDDPDGRFHEIQRVARHPDFGFHDHDHDFAVIVLEEPVELGHRAQYIGVSDADPEDGDVATVSGWGRTEFGTASRYLRAAKLRVEKWSKCQDYFPGILHPRITRNMICVKPSRSGPYFGDSGGPLVVNGKLIGLVSFGIRVKDKRKTTVFTRVKNFLDFVEEVVPGFNSK